MSTIRLKRYFAPAALDISRVRSIQQTFVTWFGKTDSCEYLLKYPAEDIGVSSIDDVTAVFADKGPTSWIRHHRKSSRGREGIFDSTNRTFISIEFYSGEKNPSTAIESIAKALGLQPLKRTIESAFIAHPFDANGKAYALQLCRFLEAYGIRTKTGEEFQLNQVPEKIRTLIDQNDVFLAVVLPQDDRTWITGELHYAFHRAKKPFVLEQIGAEHKPALLGDWENIRFSEGHISESFTKILQGFKTFRGES